MVISLNAAFFFLAIYHTIKKIIFYHFCDFASASFNMLTYFEIQFPNSWGNEYLRVIAYVVENVC